MDQQPMDAGMPQGIEVTRDYDGMTIIRKWFSPVAIFMTFFLVFWFGGLAFFFIGIMSTISQGNGVPTMALFPLIHVAVGIGLLYVTLCLYLNKTRIKVGQGKLVLKHDPIPFPGNKDLNTSDFKQLYVKKIVSHSSKGGTSITFHVMIILNSNKTIKLVSGIRDSDQALYIEQEIEKYLNIRDERVRGDYK